MHTGPFDQAKYDRWRATIPFTDEQIALALEEEAAVAPNEFMRRNHQFWADATRRGYLSKKTLVVAMGRLVKICGICGKTALYRWGTSGRCRTHKHIQTAYTLARAERCARKGAKLSQELDDIAQAERDRAISPRAATNKLRTMRGFTS